MTTETANTALVAGLRRMEAYPWQPPAVELIETHVSWVFLAGDHVVKIKRPVVYPFVGFRDLDSPVHAARLRGPVAPGTWGPTS